MIAKKKPAAGRKAPVAAAVPATAQPAAERRAAEAELQTLIDRFAPEHLKLISAVRRSLRKRLPSACEVVYEYRDFLVISISPNERGYEGVLGIRGSADGVKLYLNRGKELPDPGKLLKGSGGVMRYVEVESAATLKRPDVARLIEEAIARNTVPFASAGRGSVTVRQTTAKKKRARRPG